MNEKGFCSFVIKDWILPLLPREYREEGKQWARVRCSSAASGGAGAAKPPQQGEFTVEGRFPTISTSYILSCSLVKHPKTPNAYKINGNVSYKKRSELVTKDDVRFMLRELPTVTSDDENYELCKGLPQSLEEFKSKEIVAKLRLEDYCDYLRLDEEDYIRRVYGKKKPTFEAKISALTVKELQEITQKLKTKPWEMCFPGYSGTDNTFKELECSRYLFHIFTQKITARPMFTTAVIMYDAIKLARERGNTVFTREEIDREFQQHKEYRALELESAFTYLTYRAIVSPIDDYYCLHRDFKTTKAITTAFLCLNSFKMPTLRSWQVPCKPKDGLTERQQDFIKHTQTNALTLLQGAPGTGKSECLVALMARYRAPLVVTFVGQMVDALQVRFGCRTETAHTIHSICYAAREQYNWLAQFDLVVIDECSNVDEALFAWLLESVPRFCRLVCVGDMDQIFSIKPGCPFHDLIHCYPDHLFTLNENKRVDPNARALADAAAFIRDGNGGSVPFCNTLQIHPDLAQLDVALETYGLDIMQFQVVCLRNKDRNMLNKRIEEYLIAHGMLKIKKNTTKRPNGEKGVSLFIGKKITFTKNTKPFKAYAGVRNGELAQIKRLKEINDGLVLTTTTGKSILITRSVGRGVHPNDVTEGYATTCNKAQGSEWNHVLFYIYENPIPFFSREFAYVAVSRAKKKCVIVGNRGDFIQMCSRKATPRKTLLRLCLPEVQAFPHSHVQMQDFSLFTQLPMDIPAVPTILPEKDDTKTRDWKKRK